MIGYVYRPKRRRNGKVVFGRLYRAHIRFPGEHKTRDIPLEVTEQRSAEQKLQQILKEQESVGLIAPQKMREAAETPLADHFKVFVQELKTSGCVKLFRFNRNDTFAGVS
jgi:hypothetical protein